jgi:hypothetical protein
MCSLQQVYIYIKKYIVTTLSCKFFRSFVYLVVYFVIYLTIYEYNIPIWDLVVTVNYMVIKY